MEIQVFLVAHTMDAWQDCPWGGGSRLEKQEMMPCGTEGPVGREDKR